MLLAAFLQVFMLSSDAVLDAATMQHVLESGHSRVPVCRCVIDDPGCPCTYCHACMDFHRLHCYRCLLLPQ